VCESEYNVSYATLNRWKGTPYARQGDLNKCHLNLNREPSGGETDHRKAAKSSLVTMLSGPVVIIGRAAARATAVTVIGPAAAVVDTVFFVIDQPLAGLVGIGQ
jgi:hypothetical protein